VNKNDYLLIRVTVEIQIRHDLPRHLTADAATKTQHLTGQQPPHQSNWMTRLNINRHHLVSVCCISTHLLLSKFFPPCECQQYSVSSQKTGTLLPCDKIAYLNWFEQNLQKIMPSNLAITGKILSDNFKNWLANYWLSNFGTKITICNVVSKKMETRWLWIHRLISLAISHIDPRVPDFLSRERVPQLILLC